MIISFCNNLILNPGDKLVLSIDDYLDYRKPLTVKSFKILKYFDKIQIYKISIKELKSYLFIFDNVVFVRVYKEEFNDLSFSWLFDLDIYNKNFNFCEVKVQKIYEKFLKADFVLPGKYNKPFKRNHQYETINNIPLYSLSLQPISYMNSEIANYNELESNVDLQNKLDNLGNNKASSNIIMNLGLATAVVAFFSFNKKDQKSKSDNQKFLTRKIGKLFFIL